MATVSYPHIDFRADGEPIIEGTTTRVEEVVLDHLAYRWGAEQIHIQNPYLSLAQNGPPREEDPMQLKVIIRPGEDSGFVAHLPALRGCWSQGATRRQALRNIKEAVTAWLETEQDKAEPAAARGEIELVHV